MRRNHKNRQGSLLIEFAVLLPLVLIPLLAGIWDISTFVDINQVLTRAAREGVVMASRGADPVSPLQDYIESAGLSAANLTINIEEQEEAPGFGQEVALTLNYNLDGALVFPWAELLPNGISSVAYAKME